MQKQLLVILGFFLCSFSNLLAQESIIYTNESVAYNKALALYNDKQYKSAQLIFDKIKNSNNQQLLADATYYSANCAIRLQQPNADEKMELFIKNFPTNSKQSQAYLEVATYYFEQGNYKKALEWFDKVQESGLAEDEQAKFNFYKGYSLFNSGKKKEATQYFNQVVNSPEFGSQAKYYLGFLAYQEDDYKEATKYFDQVSGEEKYKDKLSYFQADMNFKLGKFEDAIVLGRQAMEKSNAFEQSELHKIIGESYFNLKQYDKAIPFLKEYKGRNGKWSNNDYYQLGYAYYQQQNYQNAIAQFNKIITGNDFVAQNAYYHLGESYLKTNLKPQALNAFKNASEMNFEPKIQEDATLNYARLSYDIGNSYQSIPEILANFIAKYPSNPSKNEIENLLINSFITTKNYKEAISLLEKNKFSANKEMYQKVTFYYGLEQFTNGNYPEALSLFKKSIAEQKSTLFSARATFWEAETEYTLADFDQAIITFKQFLNYPDAKNTPEFPAIYYNLAYSYFKLKDYEQAKTFFKKFIENTTHDTKRLTDSYLRLGDTQFVTSQYEQAIQSYDQAISLNNIDADYATFQQGLSYGLMGKNAQKISNFNQFLKKHHNSLYTDDVLFELANTYNTENNTKEALETYAKILTNYKSGIYNAKAILKQGLIYYNSDNYAKALEKFKQVATDYPSTEEALEAVKTARLIYVDTGKVAEYAIWVKSLKYINITDAELDNDSWEAAEKQYLQGNTKAAITNLNSYITNFPNGNTILKANFYLAESYFKDSVKSAIPYYEWILSTPKNEFTEQSLARLAKIYLEDSNYKQAIPVLLRLDVESDFPQNKIFAQINLMKAYYTEKEYEKTIIYAEKVLENPKIDDKIKSDAQIMIARSAMQTKEEDKAKLAYTKLQKIAKGELAAEALYYEAYFKNKENKYEDSNKIVQKLAKDYSAYKYFGARGLVVMAKNFYHLNDSFQATYILESVIKNFKQFEDVVAEAQGELTRIKTEVAKTNSSISK